MRPAARLAVCAAVFATVIAPVAGSARGFDGKVVLTEAELEAVTGKFILANGAEIALTVVSQTLVNNQVVLRTVFKIDTATSVEVFGRTGAATDKVYVAAPGAASLQPAGPTGVSVSFDRQSGTNIVTPTFAVASAAASAVTLGGGMEDDSAAWGLAPVAVVAGGPAVATPDGAVALAALPRGTLATLSGDQFTVSHLVGNAIASIVSNTANDRTIDTVTNVNIDLRDISAFTAESAALRVDALALDATRGMLR